MKKQREDHQLAPIRRDARRHNRSNGRGTIRQGLATREPTHRLVVGDDGMVVPGMLEAVR